MEFRITRKSNHDRSVSLWIEVEYADEEAAALTHFNA